MRRPLARRLSDTAEAILDGASSQLEGPSLDRQRIDVDPLLSRAAQAVFAYVAFAEAVDDPVRRRMVVRDRSAAIEALDASFPVQIAAYELGEHHRMALLTGQVDLAEVAVRVAERIPGMAGDALTMEAGRAMRQHHEREARALVAPVLSGEIPCVAVTSTIVAWLVEATLAIRNDQHAVAHDALLRALDLGASRLRPTPARDLARSRQAMSSGEGGSDTMRRSSRRRSPRARTWT